MRQSGCLGSYLICATPRTGSSLLCGLLASTGVAGRPESYFRRQDEQSWAFRWGIANTDGNFEYADYVQRALVAGRSENGVFAARIMWGTLDEVVGKLGTVCPNLAGRDIDLLNRAFGRTQFIYLQRDDVVAQAVSWLRAEQTQVWVAARDGPQDEPRFEFDKLSGLHRVIDNHNAAWQRWFAAVGVEPHPVIYEDLDRDPVGVTRASSTSLDLNFPPAARFRYVTVDSPTKSTPNGLSDTGQEADHNWFSCWIRGLVAAGESGWV
jgi:trehalose 2-sulfotransferase